MAHQVETMAYAGEVPWHGLGVKVIDDLTPDQMLKKAGLDWTVSTRPMYFKNTNKPEYTEIPKRRVLVRDSDETILSTVGDGWKPLQNSEAFDFFNEFVIAGDMKMDTAGSLDDGRMVWGLAKLKDGFTVSKGDDVEGYLLFSNPHKYACSIEVRFTPVRVVCNNTITLALNQEGMTGKFRVLHLQMFDEEIMRSAEQALGISGEQMKQFNEQAEFLASKKATEQKVNTFIAELFQKNLLVERAKHNNPKELPPLSDEFAKNATAVKEAIETSPGSNLASSKGTWWGALNGVTYVMDHAKKAKTRDHALTSAWFGSSAVTKRTALKKALEYAEVA